jgi:hypothetical protein
MWDALDAKFDVADAGGELYATKKFNNYRMVEVQSIVERAHEIHIMGHPRPGMSPLSAL